MVGQVPADAVARPKAEGLVHLAPVARKRRGRLGLGIRQPALRAESSRAVEVARGVVGGEVVDADEGLGAKNRSVYVLATKSASLSPWRWPRGRMK